MPSDFPSINRYPSVFLLSEDPFRAGSLHVAPEVGGFAAARDALAEALTAGPQACLLTSPPGLGKSVLLRLLAADLSAGGASVLLRSVNRWRSAQLIAEEAAGQGATILLLDDAHDLDEADIGRLLRHVETAGLSLLMAGQPELESLVPGGPAGGTTIHRLHPLRPAEVIAYVEHKLGDAGCPLNTIFSPAACETVAARSGGVPRLINRLCSSALYLAALNGDTRVEADCIAEAAASLALSPPEPAADAAADLDDGGISAADDNGAFVPDKSALFTPDDDNVIAPEEDRVLGDMPATPAGQEMSVTASALETAPAPAIEVPVDLVRLPRRRPDGIDFSMVAGASWALAAAACFLALGTYLTPDQPRRAVQQVQQSATVANTVPSRADAAAMQPPPASPPAGESRARDVALAPRAGGSPAEPDMPAAMQPFRRATGAGGLAEAPEPRPVAEGQASAVAQALGLGASQPEPDMLAAVQPFRRDIAAGRLAEAPEPRPVVEGQASAVAQALGLGAAQPEPDMLAAAQPFRRDTAAGRLAEAPEPSSGGPDGAPATGADVLALSTAPAAAAAKPAAGAQQTASGAAGQARVSDTTKADAEEQGGVPYTLAALGAAPSVSALGASSQSHQVEALLRRARTQAEALKLTTPSGDNALETYRRILELMPAHVEALAGIRDLGARYAALSRAADDPVRAERYVRKAAQLAPDHPDVRDLLAQLPARAIVDARRVKPTPRPTPQQHAGPPLRQSAIADLQDLRRALDGDAQVNLNYPDGHTPLTVAVAKGNRAALELLLRHGADPNLPVAPDGGTPLMYAAWNGEGAMVAALLGAGADPDRRNVDGKTALMAAATNGHLAIATALLKAGADPNARTRNGWTALMYAAWTKRRDIVDLIIRHDGDVTIANDKGQTARDVARQRDVPEIATILSSLKRPAPQPR